MEESESIYGKVVVVIGRLKDDNPIVVIEYLKKEHQVFLINPKMANSEFMGLKVFGTLEEVDRKINGDHIIDSVIIYMNPDTIKMSGLIDKLGNVKRVILPPGADDPDLERMIRKKGIEVIRECPRVKLMLYYTGKF